MGIAMGIANAFHSVGMLCAPIIVGHLVDSTDDVDDKHFVAEMVWIVAAAICVGSTVFLIFVDYFRKRVLL